MKDVKFYWWKGEDMEPFFSKVLTEGLDNVRIEFHPESGLLYVKNKDDKAAAERGDGGYNFVKTCPPDCFD